MRFSGPRYCGDLYSFFSQEYEQSIEIGGAHPLSDVLNFSFPADEVYNQIYGVLFLFVDSGFFFQEYNTNT